MRYGLLTILLAVITQLGTGDASAQGGISMISRRVYVEGVSTVAPDVMGMHWKQLGASKAILIDSRDLSVIGGGGLRGFLLEAKTPIFVFGEKVEPQDLWKKLDLAPRILGGGEQKVDRIQIAGTYQLSKGVYFTSEIASSKPLELAVLVERTERAADRMRTGANTCPPGKVVKNQRWEDDGGTHEREVVDPQTKGIFRQRVCIARLGNDGSSTVDWWYLRSFNTVTPGRTTGMAYSTKLARLQLRGVGVRELGCWGPSGTVVESSTAQVVIGCPGPAEQWGWATGHTRVRDGSDKGRQEGKWDVEFTIGQTEAQNSHRWEPGMQFENPEGEAIEFRASAYVEWQDSKGSVSQWWIDSWPLRARRP